MTMDHSPKRRKFHAAVLGAGLGLTGLGTLAQVPYPSKPLKLIIPFPPGTGTDAFARIIARGLSTVSGQPAVVENKPGANGIIAVKAVLAAPADGHTILFGSGSTLAFNVATVKNLPYDPIADFSPISQIWTGWNLLVVPANSPYRSLRDLIADAKARPGMLNYGTGSVGYTLSLEWLNEIAGIRTQRVNFKGAADAVVATTGGIVDYTLTDVVGALELVKSGRMRALVFTAPQRLPALPDVQTSAEAGVPAWLPISWIATAISSATPPALAQKVVELFQRAGKEPAVQQFFATQSGQLVMTTPAQLREHQTMEIERWKRIAIAVGIQPE